MKKLLLAIALILPIFSTTTSAEGFYANLGLMASETRFRFNVFSPATNTFFTQKIKRHHASGNAAIGYGFNCSSFYLGAELGTAIISDTKTINRSAVLFLGTQVTNRTTIKDHVYLDLTPGFNFTDSFMIYGRVGATTSKILISQDDTLAAAGFRKEGNRIGVRYGLGLDYRICNVGLGLDYIYTTYHRYRTLSPRGTLYNVKANKNMWGVHLRYYF